MRKTEAVWSESRQCWRISVQVDGDRREFYSKTLGRRGKIEAERKADEWIQNREGRPYRNYRELYEAYLESLQARQSRVGRGSAQYTKMESIGRIWVVPSIGHKKIDRINNADYQRVIDAAYDAGRSRRLLSHIRSAFTGVYKFARKNKIALERPEFLEVYEDAPTYPRDSMTDQDIRTLFTVDTLKDHGKIVQCYHIHAFRIMCLLGLRRGEAAGLKWSDIDDLNLHVQRSINNLGEITPGKTKAANRTIRLFPRAVEEFRSQKAMLMQLGIISPWVFANPYNGEPSYDGLGKQWAVYCRSNGIEGITLHELRHTCVSVAMGRIDPDLLKPVLGHTKQMDTFGVYGHETEDGLKTVARKLGEIFDGILAE